MCEFCKNILTKENYDMESPYLLFGAWNKKDTPGFHIDVPSDDGIRHSVDNIKFCPYCGRKLE